MIFCFQVSTRRCGTAWNAEPGRSLTWPSTLPPLLWYAASVPASGAQYIWTLLARRTESSSEYQKTSVTNGFKTGTRYWYEQKAFRRKCLGLSVCSEHQKVPVHTVPIATATFLLVQDPGPLSYLRIRIRRNDMDTFILTRIQDNDNYLGFAITVQDNGIFVFNTKQPTLSTKFCSK